MALRSASPVETCPLLRKLGKYTRLSSADAGALASIPTQERSFSTHATIAAAGKRPSRVAILREGIAARTRHLADGRRQIVSFHVPGDVLDLHNLLFAVTDHDIEAISRCRVSFLPCGALKSAMEQHPPLAQALLFDAFVDAAIGREWVTSNGRRTAYERMAHLLCELACRLHLVGEAKRCQFSLPVTQTDLADALGITAVHANRVLQLLRSERLIVTEGKSVEILDWERLVDAAGFDAGHLHLEGLHQDDSTPRRDEA